MLIRRESSRKIFLGALCVFAFGCVTDTPKKKLRKNSKKSESVGTGELESSSAQTGAVVPEAPRPAAKIVAESPKIEPMAIVTRLAVPEGTLFDGDHQAANELVNNFEPASVAEAAIVLVSLYEAIPELSGVAKGYTEAELVPVVANGSSAQPGSLEVIMETRKVNLATALSHNPLLQAYHIHSLTLRALDLGTSSAAFKDSILSVIRSQAQVWSELGGKIGINQPGPVKAFEASPSPVPSAKTVQPALKFGNGDLGNDDTVLQDAQALSDRGQYKQAITRLSQLKEDSPLYAAGQEKIRDASNKAVQELRRLAAKSFQSAIPVTDAKTKAGYLKEARAQLESALSTYPQADHLETVRENLAVINRDLQRISESGAK